MAFSVILVFGFVCAELLLALLFFLRLVLFVHYNHSSFSLPSCPLQCSIAISLRLCLPSFLVSFLLPITLPKYFNLHVNEYTFYNLRNKYPSPTLTVYCSLGPLGVPETLSESPWSHSYFHDNATFLMFLN